MKVLEQLERLSDATFLAMYEALAQQGIGPLDLEVAKLLHFRPHAIRKLPMARRAKTARTWMLGKRNTELCYEFFGTYLLKERRELVTGFLDATGVAHKDGMIEDIDRDRPDATKLAAAIAELDRKFAPEDVTLYLSMCADQWPQVGELDSLWRSRIGAPASKVG